MQNAGKHAGPTTPAVAVGDGDGRLWFEVCDDGVGFDPATDGAGHGFVNMRDRLGAFGGELTVSSRPGAGTTVAGTVPVPATPVTHPEPEPVGSGTGGPATGPPPP